MLFVFYLYMIFIFICCFFSFLLRRWGVFFLCCPFLICKDYGKPCHCCCLEHYQIIFSVYVVWDIFEKALVNCHHHNFHHHHHYWLEKVTYYCNMSQKHQRDMLLMSTLCLTCQHARGQCGQHHAWLPLLSQPPRRVGRWSLQLGDWQPAIFVMKGSTPTTSLL